MSNSTVPSRAEAAAASLVTASNSASSSLGYRGFSSASWAWALYDWANSAFATSVMAGFFPLFFKHYFAAGQTATESSFWLGFVTSAITAVTVLLLPLAAVLADRRVGLVLPALGLLTIVGALATGALVLPGRGEWLTAALLYGAAAAAFSSALVFYDALLPLLVTQQRIAALSILGYALGYLGGGVLLLLHTLFFIYAPASLGLSKESTVKFIFASVGVWWILFSLPLFRVKGIRSAVHFSRRETDERRYSLRASVKETVYELSQTLARFFRQRESRYFLLAFFCYMDGIQTIIKMAVDYGLALGLQSTHLIGALLLTQFVGVPSAFAFHWIGQRYGILLTLRLGIGVYFAVVVWAAFMQRSWEFYCLALLIGLSQGGIQALSRAWFTEFVDRTRVSQSFLFYSFLSKASAIVGPVLMGGASWYFNDPRAGTVPVAVLLIMGALLLPIARDSKGPKTVSA